MYLLASTATNERLTVRVFLNEPDLDDSVGCAPCGRGPIGWSAKCTTCSGSVRGAPRPAADPDAGRIRRPIRLRKDYPLQGRGERHNFPVLTERELTPVQRGPEFRSCRLSLPTLTAEAPAAAEAAGLHLDAQFRPAASGHAHHAALGAEAGWRARGRRRARHRLSALGLRENRREL